MIILRHLFACLITILLVLPAPAQEYFPPPASTQTQSTLTRSTPVIINPKPQAALARLQLVLDELAKGNAFEARLLAEDTVRQFGNYPELAVILAYLLQREGQPAKAAAALHSASPQSILTREYTQHLNTGRPTVLSAPQPLPQPTTANTGNSAPAGLPQSDARLAKLEQVMVQMVNEERRKAGLSPLVTDSRIADIARAHAAEMRDKNYFAHESPTASQRAPIDRYRAVVRQTPRMIAENVYRVYSTGSDTARRPLSEQDVRDGHEALMKSPGHRANILEPRVTQLGIGIVTNAKGDMWIAQLFVRP